MARSTCIYIVQSKGCMIPDGAFTVKRECNAWLKKRQAQGPIWPPYYVYRMGDNRQALHSTYVWDNPEQI